jgi:hypothetical protein
MDGFFSDNFGKYDSSSESESELNTSGVQRAHFGPLGLPFFSLLLGRFHPALIDRLQDLEDCFSILIYPKPTQMKDCLRSLEAVPSDGETE